LIYVAARVNVAENAAPAHGLIALVNSIDGMTEGGVREACQCRKSMTIRPEPGEVRSDRYREISAGDCAHRASGPLVRTDSNSVTTTGHHPEPH
jgi:hypothetical protein